MRRYAVKVNRLYNTFDAYVAVETVLYRYRHDRWVPVDRRMFDTSLSRTVGQARAEWIARKWCTEYDAERL